MERIENPLLIVLLFKDNYLGDLWRYSNSQWTWMSGSSTLNSTGVYGSKGVSSANNRPGSRHSPVSWVDSNGSLWLFGGYGYNSTNTNGMSFIFFLMKLKGVPVGYLSDLWRYSNSQWTWMSGDSKLYTPGVYGTKGVPSTNNFPGGRYAGIGWIDASGSLWLFGGYGLDSFGAVRKSQCNWSAIELNLPPFFKAY
jgi:hypothetical protein